MPTPQMLAQPMSAEQELCKNFILSRSSSGLFVPMGVGKTRIVLEALWQANPDHHVLIIAPKTIARSVWQDEIDKWGMTFRTKSLIVNEKGRQLSKAARHQLYDDAHFEKPTIYFINRELVYDLVQHGSIKNGKRHWLFPTVIIDEMQSFKSSNSQRFKALRKVRPLIQRLIGLTGTPAPNGLMDLWAQLYLIDQGERLGKYITHYKREYFYPTLYVNNHPVKWEARSGAKAEIMQRIKDVVMSVENSHLKLPPLVFKDYHAHMSSTEKEMYQTLLKTYVLQLEPDRYVEAVNSGVLTAKLSQMASGTLYYETGSKEYKRIHSHKLEIAEYIIQNSVSESVLLAYHFQSDREEIYNYLKKKKIDVKIFDKSPEMIKDWNNKKIPVMLIQPASAGHGLNLQDGGHSLIWYTIPWSLELYLQTNARIYRQGQKNTTTIHHLITKDTVDERIIKVLGKKESTQQTLLDAVAHFVSESKT